MLELPKQTAVFPVIAPGVDGIVFIVRAKFLGALVPQALLAVTVILPPVAFAVVVILFVVDVPLHPNGNVQV